MQCTYASTPIYDVKPTTTLSNALDAAITCFNKSSSKDELLLRRDGINFVNSFSFGSTIFYGTGFKTRDQYKCYRSPLDTKFEVRPYLDYSLETILRLQIPKCEEFIYDWDAAAGYDTNSPKLRVKITVDPAHSETNLNVWMQHTLTMITVRIPFLWPWFSFIEILKIISEATNIAIPYLIGRFNISFANDKLDHNNMRLVTYENLKSKTYPSETNMIQDQCIIINPTKIIKYLYDEIKYEMKMIDTQENPYLFKRYSFLSRIGTSIVKTNYGDVAASEVAHLHIELMTRSEIINLQVTDFVLFRNESTNFTFKDAIVTHKTQDWLDVRFVNDTGKLYTEKSPYTCTVDLQRLNQNRFLFGKHVLSSMQHQQNEKQENLVDNQELQQCTHIHLRRLVEIAIWKCLRLMNINLFSKEILNLICEYAPPNEFVIHMKQMECKVEHHDATEFHSNSAHKEAKMIVSHPLSIKAKNVFLLKCMSADCHSPLYNGFWGFSFGIFSMDRYLYPWNGKNVDYKYTENDNYIPFERYKLLTTKKKDNKHVFGCNYDGNRHLHAYYIDVPVASSSIAGSVNVKPKFRVMYSIKTCQKKQDPKHERDFEEVIQHTSIHCLDNFESDMLVNHLHHSNNRDNNSGIYLKFINSIQHPGYYNLSFELWDQKCNQYHFLGDAIEVDVEQFEWHIVFRRPCCDCKNTNGHTYLLQRIE